MLQAFVSKAKRNNISLGHGNMSIKYIPYGAVDDGDGCFHKTPYIIFRQPYYVNFDISINN